jgi:hypothetical protein
LFFIFGDLGFFVFQLSNIIAGADPVKSFEAQGGLPQALTTR